MTAELFPALVSDPSAVTPTLAQTYYLLAAWYQPGRYWKIFKDLWLTEEVAHRAGAKLKKGWTEYCVVRVDLPGGQSHE